MLPREIFRKIKKEGRTVLTEVESREALQHYKIPLVEAKVVKNENEAADAAQKFGYPIAMKIVSPDVVHKTDVGGVVLNIKGMIEAEDAFEKIIHNAKIKKSTARIDGVVVQKQVSGIETIIGGKKDSQFGQVVMFGFGGVYTEIFDDTSFRVCPMSKKDAEEMVKEIKGYKILSGYRGKKYDVSAVVATLLKISEMLEENPQIVELDINPFIVMERGAVAVDARIVVE